MLPQIALLWTGDTSTTIVAFVAAVVVVCGVEGACRRLRRRDECRGRLQQVVADCFPDREWRGRIGLSVRPYIVVTGARVTLTVLAWSEWELADVLLALTHRLPRNVDVTVDGTTGDRAVPVVRLTARGMAGNG